VLTNNRLFYLWCVLAVGIVFVAVLPSSYSAYIILAEWDSNRWVHFLAYAAVAAVPVAAWNRRMQILLSFIPLVICVALELIHSILPGTIVRSQNVPADLFGIAAGILFGLNLRVAGKTGRRFNEVATEPSHTAIR
jgi:hypothetical protein